MRLCLGKINFIFMGISALMILVGFVLMVSEPSSPEKFNPEVFAPLHWPIAGTICFLGYVLMIVGICVKGKRGKTEETIEND